MLAAGWLAGAALFTLVPAPALSAGIAEGSAAAAAAAAGFQSHGVPVAMAQPRGIIATEDGAGRDVVLSWLQDYRGGYAVLMVDAETGEAHQFEAPFSPDGDEPFALLLSRKNRLYTLFNGYFIEFDPVRRGFSFWTKVGRGTAMSLTEDGQGRIWAATYPDNRLVMFDPARTATRVYGPLAHENWQQYPRAIAADDRGWIYVAVGKAAAQIYAFEPDTATVRPQLRASERRRAHAGLIQTGDGQVYGKVSGRFGQRWFQLAGGRRERLSRYGRLPAHAPVAGAQNLVARRFPSGRVLLDFDLMQRKLLTRNASGEAHTVSFSYGTQGALLTQVSSAPDGELYGGARFPMHVFRYDAVADEYTLQFISRQPNVILPRGEQLYVAGYPDGMLLQFDRLSPGLEQRGQPARAGQGINRPHAMLVQSSGARLLMAGTPEYGHRGGGMLFIDREKGAARMAGHQQLVPWHSTQSMIELSSGLVLAGTTTRAGTGGVHGRYDSARLYLLEPGTGKRLWQTVPVPGAQTITDLVQRDDGLVYGLADSIALFVFDPVARRVIHRRFFHRRLGVSVYAQGTRAFVPVPRRRGQPESIFLLLANGIARIDPADFSIDRVARSPVEISVGGAYARGRIYFGSNSELYSWGLPQ